MRSRTIWAIGAVLALGSTTANAGIIFVDNFDTTGGTRLNWDGGANWSVQNGTVDLVASGDYGIDCLGGRGHCVDLDGSNGQAGEIMSIDLGPLDPGKYNFSYWLSGNQRAGDQTDFAFAVSLSNGSLLSMAAHVLTGSDGWQRYWQTFVLNEVADSVYLNFSHLGGDKVGIVLDNVQLRVAEPAVLALLGLGLLVAGRVSRRA